MLPRPQLFASSTTLTLTAGSVVVTKIRVPIDSFGSPQLHEEVVDRARRATLDEASWLARARHPGVVRLHHVAPVERRLETVLAGRASLRTVSLSASQARMAILDLASTLADLHARGLVHGRLAPEHVIVDGRRPGHVVLCSPSGTENDPTIDLQALVGIAEHLNSGFARSVPGWSEAIDDLRARGSTIESPDVVTVFDGPGVRSPALLRRLRWGLRRT